MDVAIVHDARSGPLCVLGCLSLGPSYLISCITEHESSFTIGSDSHDLPRRTF